MKNCKYTKEIKPGVVVDVYDVLRAWEVQNPALMTMIRKALQVGNPGHKSKVEDMDDIIACAVRAKELECAEPIPSKCDGQDIRDKLAVMGFSIDADVSALGGLQLYIRNTHNGLYLHLQRAWVYDKEYATPFESVGEIEDWFYRL